MSPALGRRHPWHQTLSQHFHVPLLLRGDDEFTGLDSGSCPGHRSGTGRNDGHEASGLKLPGPVLVPRESLGATKTSSRLPLASDQRASHQEFDGLASSAG
jgi:hypothetical protein